MTKEEKQLLLIDLCARLPYGVKIHINSSIEEQNSMKLFSVNLEGGHIGVGNEKWAFRAIPIIDDEDETKVIKPYLRPMSSMTEEERVEYRKAFDKDFAILEDSIDAPIAYEYPDGMIVRDKPLFNETDWLNKKMFDYRGLIPMGLALEATEDMYKTE